MDHVQTYREYYARAEIPWATRIEYEPDDAPDPQWQLNDLWSEWFEQTGWEISFLGHTLEGKLTNINSRDPQNLFFTIELDPPIEGVEQIGAPFEYFRQKKKGKR